MYWSAGSGRADEGVAWGFRPFSLGAVEGAQLVTVCQSVGCLVCWTGCRRSLDDTGVGRGSVRAGCASRGLSQRRMDCYYVAWPSLFSSCFLLWDCKRLLFSWYVVLSHSRLVFIHAPSPRVGFQRPMVFKRPTTPWRDRDEPSPRHAHQAGTPPKSGPHVLPSTACSSSPPSDHKPPHPPETTTVKASPIKPWPPPPAPLPAPPPP